MVDILIDSASREVIYAAAANETIDVQADKTMVTGGDHTRQFPQSTADSEVVAASDPPDDFVGGDKFIYDAQGNWTINTGWTSYEDPDSTELSGLCYVLKDEDNLRVRETHCMSVDEDGNPVDVVQEKIFVYSGRDLLRTTIKKYDVDGNVISDKTFDAKVVEQARVFMEL